MPAFTKTSDPLRSERVKICYTQESGLGATCRAWFPGRACKRRFFCSARYFEQSIALHQVALVFLA